VLQMTSHLTLKAPADSQVMAFCQEGTGMLPGRDSILAYFMGRKRE